MQRTVFFISDGTGITAETLGRSLLTQFENISFDYDTIPNVNTLEKAKAAVQRIEAVYQKEGVKPIIFATVIDPTIGQLLKTEHGMLMDFFQAFINPLENELGCHSSHTVGRSHGVHDYTNYMQRMQAVNFALGNDDGASTKEYAHADVILIGVSRCGKTPTCLYLALQFGVFAANYPFVDDDLQVLHLPKALRPYKSKLFGLTIDAERLSQIREERRPESAYAHKARCEFETKRMETLLHSEKIPYLDTTHRSIEEIASEIMSRTGLKRRLF